MIFSLFGFLILSYCATAQIKVYDDNRVKVFGDKTSDDPNKDLSMQIYGSYGTYLANGRLGFGEYNDGNVFDANKVFVGELGNNYDSDKLELSGSNGVYLTWGQGYGYNNIIGKLDIKYVIVNDVWTDISSFQFMIDVYAKGLILNSDERFKENIKPLQSSLSKLTMVRGVSYNLKTKETSVFSSVNYDSPSSEKEQNDLALLATTKEKMKNINRKRLGFVAEEIKEIFPDLVEEDSNGYLHVDYIGLIPILVESIKQQQSQIATIKSFLTSQKQ